MNDKDTAIQFDAIEPSRDLWPGIESKITSKRPWKGFAAGIAASLVIIPMVLLWQATGQTPVEDSQGVIRSALVMQSAHERMVAPYSRTIFPSGIDVALDELATAEKAIHGAIQEDPGNERLLAMLSRVHKHRLGVLTKSIKVQEYI